VKRCIFFFLLLLSTPSIARADGTDAKSATPAIDLYSDSHGVGIGTMQPLVTLDVSRGEIKIGSTGAVCTHMLAGTLRYATARLQLCDGRQWRNVSLDRNE